MAPSFATAPDTDELTVVAILAREGWTVERIARVLKRGTATVKRRLATLRRIEAEAQADPLD